MVWRYEFPHTRFDFNAILREIYLSRSVTLCHGYFRQCRLFMWKTNESSRSVTVCHGLSRAPWLWLILKPVRIMRFCGVSSLTKPETVWSHPMGCWRTWKHAIVISQEFGVVTTSSSHTGKAEHVWNCSNYQTNPQDLGGHHDHSN